MLLKIAKYWQSRENSAVAPLSVSAHELVGSADGAGVGTDIGACAAANQSPESVTKRLIEAAMPHTARA